MPLVTGRYHFGDDTGTLRMRTAREGMASAAGHDLVIEVTRWTGTADIDVAAPERSHVELTADARSLAVRSGTGGVKPLSERDKQEITAAINRKILDTARHPAIRFVSSDIGVNGIGVMLDGDLTIRDVTRHVRVAAHQTEDLRFAGAATVVQTRWSITPYRGLLGALKVADAVEIEFDVTLRAT